MAREEDITTGEEAVGFYGLPALPEGDDGPEARQLILFRQDAPRVYLTGPVTLEDAQEYAGREDTHGDGWFVGYDLY